ncbi:MAG TPA: hypothetical protein VFD06_03275 [Candidatus Polarisedimenticolia bacterium]|nr:hypothetical protein [Candidatus Polarisedimenticolia bacterium]
MMRTDLLVVMAAAAFLSPGLPLAADSRAMNYPPDVIAQFDALSHRPDPLGFVTAFPPEPTECMHFQGMVRRQADDGTTYFYISRSANIPVLPDGLFCEFGETAGDLRVVRMWSRDENGERLRSNRLQRGVNLTLTAPPIDDQEVNLIRFDGNYGWPKYRHPGGMQLIGQVLALGLEKPYDDETLPPWQVLFLDVRQPELPLPLGAFAPEDVTLQTAIVGITTMPDDHYLMVVTGGDNHVIGFYRSQFTNLVDFYSAQPRTLTEGWDHVDTWEAAPIIRIPLPGGGTYVENPLSPDEEYAGQNWPGDPSHQTFQFLREGGRDGTLYVAGALGDIFGDDDRLDLYRLDCEAGPNCAQGQIRLKWIASRLKSTRPNADPSAYGSFETANLAAASTFYVSPSGELLFYATEHANQGPDGSVRFGEWRHTDLVRPGSPTFSPTVDLFEHPFDALEGGAVVLRGFALPPVTKAFVQLFADPGFHGRYVVVEYDDWARDDFDNFHRLDYAIDILSPTPDAPVDDGFSDDATSWRWFAPSGCTLRVNDHQFGHPDFPGPSTLELPGTGALSICPDLRDGSEVCGPANMNDDITSVEFLPDCDDYYGAPMTLEWDLDLDGVCESAGSLVVFSTLNFDGPGTVQVPVRAVHPRDGRTTLTSGEVAVYNVAPAIGSFRVSDPLGREIGTEVPFVVQGLPITVTAQFTDPGRPDHQTADIGWGDGVVESESAFGSFSDAFGGRTGALRHSHTHALAGSYRVGLSVTDDDGGPAGAAGVVRVVSPAGLVTEAIGLIDARLAAAADPRLIKALQKARKALAGSPEGHGSNGVIDKLGAGATRDTLVMLRGAIDDLRAAQALGADVGAIVLLLEQLVLALSL